MLKIGGFSTDSRISCSVALIEQKTGANTWISRQSSGMDIDMHMQEVLTVKTGGFSTDPRVSCSVALIEQKTGANTQIAGGSSELDIDVCT